MSEHLTMSNDTDSLTDLHFIRLWTDSVASEIILDANKVMIYYIRGAQCN